MAELIPFLNTCLPNMTSGEKRLARRLEAFLEDDYLCWYDIPLVENVVILTLLFCTRQEACCF